MYTFTFSYTNGSNKIIEHVERVRYSNPTGKVDVPSDSILTHDFPLRYDLHLFCKDSSAIVSANNLAIIEIIKD